MHAHTMLLFYLILILEEVFVVAEVDVVVNTVCVCVTWSNVVIVYLCR